MRQFLKIPTPVCTYVCGRARVFFWRSLTNTDFRALSHFSMSRLGVEIRLNRYLLPMSLMRKLIGLVFAVFVISTTLLCSL